MGPGGPGAGSVTSPVVGLDQDVLLPPWWADEEGLPPLLALYDARLLETERALTEAHTRATELERRVETEVAQAQRDAAQAKAELQGELVALRARAELWSSRPSSSLTASAAAGASAAEERSRHLAERIALLTQENETIIESLGVAEEESARYKMLLQRATESCQSLERDAREARREAVVAKRRLESLDDVVAERDALAEKIQQMGATSHRHGSTVPTIGSGTGAETTTTTGLSITALEAKLRETEAARLALTTQLLAHREREEELAAENVVVRDQFTDMSSALAAMHRRVEHLESAVDRAQRRTRAAEAASVEAKAQEAAATSRLEAVVAELQHTHHLAREARAQGVLEGKEAAERDFADAQREVSDSAAERATLRADRTATQARLTAAVAERDALQRELSDLRGRLADTVAAESGSALAERNRVVADLTRMTARVHALEEEAARFRTDRDADRVGSASGVEEWRRAAQAARGRAEVAESAKRDAEDLAERRAAERDALSDRLRALEVDYRSAVSKLQAQLDGVTRDQAESQTVRASTLASLTTAKQEAEKDAELAREAMRRAEEARREAARLDGEKVRTLEKDVHEAKVALTSATRSWEATVAALGRERDDAATRAASFEGMARGLEARVGALEARVREAGKGEATAKREVEDLLEAKRNAVGQWERSRTEAARWERRAEEMEARVREMEGQMEGLVEAAAVGRAVQRAEARRAGRAGRAMPKGEKGGRKDKKSRAV